MRKGYWEPIGGLVRLIGMRLRRILVVSFAVLLAVVVLSQSPAEAPLGDGASVPETSAPLPVQSEETTGGLPESDRDSPWLPAGIAVAGTAVAGLLYLSRS